MRLGRAVAALSKLPVKLRAGTVEPLLNYEPLRREHHLQTTVDGPTRAGKRNSDRARLDSRRMIEMPPVPPSPPRIDV